jgi:hypothetical protein
MKTFSFYPNTPYTLPDGKIIEIEPYRVEELAEYVLPLDKAKSTLMELQLKASKILPDELLSDDNNGMTDKDLSDDEISNIKDLLDEIEETRTNTVLLSNRLAQLGLKRALYPDASDKIGKELDEYPDIGIMTKNAQEIRDIMIGLANNNMPVVDDTKKAGKQKTRKKSSKTSTTE